MGFSPRSLQKIKMILAKAICFCLFLVPSVKTDGNMFELGS